jgi:7,8-dihydropterin-6-yl-methyl-4-(beta-D-ribofuranosyl)aminobenzene 5'-phosphate synthase
MPVPGHDPFEMPVLSRQAVREADFELIEKQNPSFLFDSSVLITGEIDRHQLRNSSSTPAPAASR